MTHWRCITLSLFLVALVAHAWNVNAATPGSVVINEVAWMGTQADANDEWIELHNTTDQLVDLANWKLVAADGTPNITLSGAIPAHGFFLLERTDETTVSDLAADKIYTGALSNSGEALFLKDITGTVIDSANANGGSWPAGNSTTRATMERINPLLPDSDANWVTNNGVIHNGIDVGNNPIRGTPKAQNSTVNLPPTANAGLDQQANEGTLVMLDDSASSDPNGDSLACTWEAGDGSGTLSGCAVSHSYADNGVFVARLTVDDGRGGTSTDTTQITILNVPPTVDAGPDQTAPVGQLMHFLGSFTDPGIADTHTIQWDFGDEQSASGTLNPTHSYFAAGTYTATLTITDDDGGVGMDTLNVTVRAPTLSATKRVKAPNGSHPVAGEELEYEIEITNISSVSQPDNFGNELEDPIPAQTAFVEDSLTASSGSAVFDSAGNQVIWNGTVLPSEVITIRFRVKVDEELATGSEVINQGRVLFDADGNGSNETIRLTDDPDTPEPSDPTRAAAIRKGDANGDGTIDSRDAVLCAEIALQLRIPTDLEEVACDVAVPYGIIDGRDVVRIAEIGLKSATLSLPYASRTPWIERAFKLQNIGTGYTFLAQGHGSQAITIDIYDLYGQRVFTSGHAASDIAWHAHNQDGKRLANGIYLYVITMYGLQDQILHREVGRLILLR